MKIEKPTEFDPHYYFHLSDKCFFHFTNEWWQLFGSWNWVTATLIKAEFENEKMTGGWTIDVIFFGFGIYLRYNYDFEGSETGQRFKEFEEEQSSKKQIKQAVDKAFEDYGETIMKLDNE